MRYDGGGHMRDEFKWEVDNKRAYQQQQQQQKRSCQIALGFLDFVVHMGFCYMTEGGQGRCEGRVAWGRSLVRPPPLYNNTVNSGIPRHLHSTRVNGARY